VGGRLEVTIFKGVIGLHIWAIVVGLLALAWAGKYWWVVFIVMGALYIVATASQSYFTAASVERKRLSRYEQLREKYGSASVAQRIVDREIWVGQSFEQVCESFGEPHAIDSTAGKGRPERVTWLYDSIGRWGYETRITAEHGLVVSWKTKQR